MENPEEPIIFIRKSFYIYLPQLLMGLILILLYFGGLFLLLRYLPIIFKTSFKNILVVFSSLYFLILWLYFLLGFFNYYFDIGVVTSERLLDIDQIGIFHRTLSELPIVKIQDVKVEVKGFFPTYLHFGNLYIETAGEAPNFLFEAIPNPYKVADRILEIHHQATKRIQGTTDV